MYNPPQVFTISKQLDEVFVRGAPVIKENEVQGCLTDIKFQLKKYFESPDVLTQTLDNIKVINSSPKLNHFIKGDIWKSKIIEYNDKLVLPIFLYFDAFQINDALGTHAHSTCGIYYSIPVIPQHELSHLKNIFIAGFLNANDMKYFGNEKTLKRLIEVLNSLGVDGLDINVNNEQQKIYFLLGQILGDNLGLNEILGYNTSFNSQYYCRICTKSKHECKQDYKEQSQSIRNYQTYDIECISEENNTSAKKSLFGIMFISFMLSTINHVISCTTYSWVLLSITCQKS